MNERIEAMVPGHADRGARIAVTAGSAPWFVQFWPVFIACLMAASIAASLATVVIAYRHADVDVRPGHGGARAEASVGRAPTARGGAEADESSP
ncbi:MAG: hypothetical protein R3F35_05630 [Myxococcota bacterium]